MNWRKKHKKVKLAEKEISSLSNKLKRKLNRKLNYWLTKFAVNNEISMADVKEYLNSDEIKDLEYDVFDYIELAKNAYIDDEKTQELLVNLSSRYHIARLEAVKTQIELCLKTYLLAEIEIINNLLNQIYHDTYFNTIYDVSEGLNASVNMFVPNKNKIDMLIKKPWTDDGVEFSKRIWGEHRKKLTGELEKSLTDSIIKGENAVKLSNDISEKFGVKKHHAKTILHTESAHISEVARTDCFDDLGVEKYIIVATLDHKTSKKCRRMDGKVFELKDLKIGVNAPPFHPNCRTTKAPYIDYAYGLGERAARDKDGKTIYVPEGMTYDEWYKTYVETAPDYLLEEKKWKNRHSDKKQLDKYNSLGYDVTKNLDKFQNMKYNNPKEWDLVKGYGKSAQNGEISPLIGYKNFKKYHTDLEDKLTGLKFVDGNEVKGVSYHFTARAIGTHDCVNPNNSKEIMRRLNHKHVPTEKLIECIKMGEKAKESKNSVLYKVGKVGNVTFNPITGTLVQCNPRNSK